MIPILQPGDPFPPVDRALHDPNGLLAVGASLDVATLAQAYARGIFPWFGAGDPVLWWSPDPRMVLRVDELHVSRSLARRMRRGGFSVTADAAFVDVVAACAQPRRSAARRESWDGLDGPDEDGDDDGTGGTGTWLVPSMQDAYVRLHAAGFAHSIEVWMDGDLSGGLYGVALGRMFYGESMFTRRADASKIALARLAAQLRRWGLPLIDCQLATGHLVSMGAREISRREFVDAVDRLVRLPPVAGPWRIDDDLAGTPGNGGPSTTPPQGR